MDIFKNMHIFEELTRMLNYSLEAVSAERTIARCMF
jgi:hypothetical protein